MRDMRDHCLYCLLGLADQRVGNWPDCRPTRLGLSLGQRAIVPGWSVWRRRIRCSPSRSAGSRASTML